MHSLKRAQRPVVPERFSNHSRTLVADAVPANTVL
jgi:hypothetical protein